MKHQDMKLQCQFETACRSDSIVFQAVRWAAAFKIGVYFIFYMVHRLEYAIRQSLQRGAGIFGGSSSRDSKIAPHTNSRASMPNPSFKPSPNSVAGGGGPAGGACGPFCACWPARHAVGSGLTRTLGLAKPTVRYSRKAIACQLVLTRHEMARCDKTVSHHGLSKHLARREKRLNQPSRTLCRVNYKAPLRRLSRSTAWEALVFSQFIGPPGQPLCVCRSSSVAA
jgi:hypothetical protein